MNRILTIYFSIKRYKLTQIFYRVIRPLRRIFSDKKNYKVDKKLNINGWITHLMNEETISNNMVFKFSNVQKKLDLPKDWESIKFNKLWTYNLHYFDDLQSFNCKKKSNLHKNIINNWVQNCRDRSKIGWDPYPTSLRIVNILKSYLDGNQYDEKVHNSIYTQSKYLFTVIEKDLLANHLISNLKALLFSSVVYGDKKLFSYAADNILREIEEQIHEDGFHFELSPMYHRILVVDLLDIFNLLKGDINRCKVSKKIIEKLKKILPKMMRVVILMSHNNKEISMFNDSANGIAADLNLISEYYEKLGIKYLVPEENQTIFDLKKSGYFCVQLKQMKVIFDVGNVGPVYQPGHSHADTLSFELSIDGEIFFINSGT